MPDEQTHTDVHTHTPAGETGVADMRIELHKEGQGHVADAAGVRNMAEPHERTPPGPDLTDYPSGDDPFGTPIQKAVNTGRPSDDPTYESGQGTADPSTGGSVDTHDFMTHANSGDETEESTMIDKTDNKNQPVVDGYSDTQQETEIDSPDPGVESKIKPMDPDEFAKAQKEARSEEHEKKD